MHQACEVDDYIAEALKEGKTLKPNEQAIKDMCKDIKTAITAVHTRAAVSLKHGPAATTAVPLGLLQLASVETKIDLLGYLARIELPHVVDPFVATNLLDMLRYPLAPTGGRYLIGEDAIKKIFLEGVKKEKALPTYSATMTEENLWKNLNKLALMSNMFNGHETFAATGTVHRNNIPGVNTDMLIGNNGLQTSVLDNLDARLNELELTCLQKSNEAYDFASDGDKVNIYIEQEKSPYHKFPMMPIHGGGVTIFNQPLSPIYRKYFELKRKQMRGVFKDISENSWNNIMKVLNNMRQQELVLENIKAMKGTELSDLKKYYTKYAKYVSRIGDIIVSIQGV